MKLAALRLHNVRRFAGDGVAIEDIRDGVNVLCAANEHGKSTCFDALHALFFQSHTGTSGTVQALKPYSGGNPRIEADVVTPDGRYRILKQFLGGKRASVTDLGSGRLLAQADEAEAFIGDLVRGGAAGPAGLLWVRQGPSGFERRQRNDDESEKRAREGILSSVQGEVEVLTGGRRMTDVLASCERELAELVTPTGRPKTNGAYARAIEERARQAEREQGLRSEVDKLRRALDDRRRLRSRLVELTDPAQEATREGALAQAEAALAAAREQQAATAALQAQVELARSRHEAAEAAFVAYGQALARAEELNARQRLLAERRGEAIARRREAETETAVAARAVDVAEREETEARVLFMRLEKALAARDAADRLASLRKTLEAADGERKAIESGEAALKTLMVPAEALAELTKLERDISVLRAAAEAQAPKVEMAYLPGAEGRVAIDGTPLIQGEERRLETRSVLDITGIGMLTVHVSQDQAHGEELAAAEEKHRGLLERLGAISLAEVQLRDSAGKSCRRELELSKRTLSLLAPKGVEALQAEMARLVDASKGELELKGDPVQAGDAWKAAEARMAASRATVTMIRAVREQADKALLEAERAFATVSVDLAATEGSLGPQEKRAERESELFSALTGAETSLRAIEAEATAMRGSATDVASATAAASRLRSVVAAARTEAATLREELADLSGQIRTRADDAVEEMWQEAQEAHAAAAQRVERFVQEVALLTRLRDALQLARTEARDHYFEPVMRELRPLLGLLFEDASVTFDEATLLPQKVRRNGLEEPVGVLSGGMREQLAVLTRLAFSKLLARDGRAAPVILDDALVYSDDDRIERMFNALHRQSLDQQIIVLSCRQRAFSQLGGNVLQIRPWTPEQ